MSVIAEPWHLVMEFIGIDLDDDAVADALAPTDGLDVLWSSSEGIATAEATVSADSLPLAIATLVSAATSATPTADLLRILDPLVAISDIADAAGVSRQAARNWALGHRQSGFPLPVAIVGDGIRVWRLAEVHEWLHQTLALCEDRRFPSAVQVAAFNEFGFDGLRHAESEAVTSGDDNLADVEWTSVFARTETQEVSPQQARRQVVRRRVSVETE